MKITWTKPHLLDDMITPELYRDEYVNNLSKVINCGLKVKSLSDYVSSIYRGFTPEHKDNNCNSDYLLLKTVNIRRNYLDLSSSFAVSEKVFSENPRYHVNENDALITIMGATDDVLGRAWSFNSKKHFLFSDGVAILKNIKGIDKEYLVSYLNSEVGHKSILQWSSGSTRKYITNERLAKIKIPEPSLEIQNYIGNKVRKAEELREEAKWLKEEAESLLSLVLKLDEFKYEVTKSWVVNAELLEPYLNVQYYNKEYLSFQEHLKSLGIPLLKMSQVLFKIIRNNSPDENDRVEKGIPSLIVSDIDPYRIEIENAKIQVSQDYYKANEHQAILVDDVVYTTAGPPLGEACLVVDEMLPLLSGAHVAVLRTNENCKPGYLTCVLNSLVGSLEVQKHSYGIRQQYLFNEQLSNFVIPIIAQEIQDEIHEKISKAIKFEIQSKKFISEAKQDVEDLIEGKFDESRISEGV
jgi:type I restriction enzyme, S subunit